MRLTGPAMIYWASVEGERYMNVIDTWRDMKAMLKEDYLPVTFRCHFLDRLHTLC